MSTPVQDVVAGSVVVRPFDFATGTVTVRVPGEKGDKGDKGDTGDTGLGGDARIFTPEQFGAVGGLVTDDSAAFYDALWGPFGLDANGGGVLLLTKTDYTAKIGVLPSGVTITSLASGQMMTGAGFACTVHMPAGATGWMIDGYNAQRVTVTGAAGGSYDLTGGWGASATVTINQSDSTATILTKIRAGIPGFGAVTLDAAATPSLYRILLDESIGDHPHNGAIHPAKLSANAASLTGTSPTVAVKEISCDGSGVFGIALLGTVGTITAGSQGGIRMRDQTRFCTNGVSGNGFNLGVIKVGGVGATILNTNALNFAATDLTEYIGVITTYGADHTIDGGELSGSTLPGSAFGDPTNRYHCGLSINSTTTVVRNALAEFGDTGIYAGGSMTRFEHCRVDMSGGHGVLEPVYAFDQRFTDLLILSCGHVTDNTYDGMNLNGIGHTVRGVSAELSTNFIGLNRMRYVVFENDTTTDALTLRNYPSTVDGLVAAVNTYASDIYLSSFGFPCYQSSSGAPLARPQSAHMLGRTWLDTRTTPPRMTYASTTGWRDGAGDMVGNVLPASLSIMRTSGGWQVYATTSTLSWLDGHTDFRVPHMVQAVCTSAGVTAGYCGIISTGAGTLAYVDPGRAYTPVCHALGPTGATVSYVIQWYDVSNTLISSSTATTPVAVGTTDTLALAGSSPVSPATAHHAYLIPLGARSGLTAGDVFKFARIGLIPGTTANESELP